MIRKYQAILNRFFMILDSSLISLSLFLAWFIKFHTGWFIQSGRLDAKSYFSILVFIIPIFLIFNTLFGLYSSKRSKSLRTEIWGVIKSTFFTGFSTASILFFIKQLDYSRSVLLQCFILVLLFLTAERIFVRYVLRSLRSKGYNLKHIVILGAGELGTKFLQQVREHPEFGYHVLGFLDDQYDVGLCKKNGVSVLGNLQYYEQLITDQEVDQVFIALPLSAHPRLEKLILASERMGVQTFIIPDYYSYLPARPRFEEFGGIPLIDVRHVPLDDIIYATLKRFMDIALSVIILILLSPLLVCIAFGVKVTSPGPILFKQERVGKNRKTFYMYKFRSMVHQVDDNGFGWTVKHDNRRTKFGTFLRKTSLDELPQFLNVLNGDMSIVGPRPERPYYVEQFKDTVPKYMVKHRVRPGITGWAQINGWRGDTSIEERIKCDLYYIENWTFSLDAKIFLLTFIKGFINRNAY